METTNRQGVNHPLANRMGLLAFLSQTFTFGCMWGTFGVLLVPVEAKLGVTREISSLGVPLVLVSSALLAPVAGILAGKMSLRVLMMIGALLSAAGYTLLAFSHSVAAYLVAYGLLVGPGLCLCGTVLPSALVTRWFTYNRGRALGFVNMPIVIAILPLIVSFGLRAYGLATVYVALAGLMALVLLPTLFIVDFPPSSIDPSGEDEPAEAAAHPGMTTGQLLREPRFWALTLAMAAIFSGQVVFGAHLVPMARLWGVDARTAAGLLSLSSLTGMVGTLVFGWISDKIGGRTALTIACVDCIILWSILLLHVPFGVLAAVVALIAFHGAAVIPVFGMALSQMFGQASFGRAFGLGMLGAFPFLVAAAPLAGFVFVRTGSYADVLAGYALFYAVITLLVALVGGRQPVRLADATT